MDDDQVPDWAVGLAYLAAIGLNLVWLWRSMDEAQRSRVLDPVRRWRTKVDHRLMSERRWHRAVAETMIDAEVTVEMAAKERHGEADE